MQKIRIAIVDDHNIIIDGLVMLLSAEKNLEISKTYNDGYELIEDLRNQKIELDIILMDLMMPNINGYDCSKIIKKEFPNIKIIILSMNCEAKTIHDLINKIEVEGYLNKTVCRKDLIAAIDNVNKGYIDLSNEANETLSNFREKIINYPEIKLSGREKEIVQQMISGFTNKEISENLFISERTVETHRKNIYRKTDTHSLTKLLQLVNDLDLLKV